MILHKYHRVVCDASELTLLHLSLLASLDYGNPTGGTANIPRGATWILMSWYVMACGQCASINRAQSHFRMQRRVVYVEDPAGRLGGYTGKRAFASKLYIEL